MEKSTNISLTPQPPEDRIRAMIETVEEQFGINITVRDRFGVLRLPNGRPVIQRRSQHQHPYCQAERQQRTKFNQACNDYCAGVISKQCAATKDPFISHCWKGVREVIVPIWRGEEQMITLFAGGWRDPLATTCPVHDATSTLQQAYQGLLPVQEKEVQRISVVLTTLGLGLLEEIDVLHGKAAPGRGRNTQIKEFIRHHAQQPLSLESLAEHLELSPSRTSQVVKDLFHTPFQELVIQERLARAKTLLISTERSQDDISIQCGFRSQHYFNRLFKKHVGVPPGKYRRDHRS